MASADVLKLLGCRHPVTEMQPTDKLRSLTRYDSDYVRELGWEA